MAAPRDRTPLDDAFRRCRAVLASVILFSFFINLLMFVGPLYMLQVYDRVLASRSVYTLLMLTLIAGGLLLCYGLLEAVRARVLVRTAARFDEALAPPLFATVFKGRLKMPTGGQAQALRDMDTIREAITGNGIVALCDAPWVPIFLLGCFVIHPWLGWIATGGAAAIFCIALINELAAGGKLAAGGRAAIVAHNYAASALDNAEAIRAMGMTPAIRARWAERHREALGWQAAASAWAGSLLAASKFVRLFLQVAILGAGAYLAIQREITPGAMIAASIIMARALAPVEIGVANWRTVTAARAARARLQALFRNVPAEPEPMPLPAPEGALAVENAVAAPPGGRVPVLRGVSFELPAGQTLAVVGPSAAGKSSLARLLVGVWQPVAGAVRVDGSELAHWDADAFGKHVGYLPQDVELFAGTVAENIARFADVDHEAVIKAADMAGVHAMIQQLPDGYDTEIGDGGQALSGGQRQRVALARALYGDPAIVVLDEPNANLDHAGEEALSAALGAMKKAGQTVVVVSHKPQMLSLVDKILVLHQGTVHSYGVRDEILRKIAGPKVVAAAGRGEPRLGGARAAATP